jgi:hypothetical protein
MITLICIVITALTVYYVFSVPEILTIDPEKTRATYLRERKEVVYENLRDLNFEYKAGKLPDADYQNMKTSLEEEAAAILSELSGMESGLKPQGASS